MRAGTRRHSHANTLYLTESGSQEPSNSHSAASRLENQSKTQADSYKAVAKFMRFCTEAQSTTGNVAEVGVTSDANPASYYPTFPATTCHGRYSMALDGSYIPRNRSLRDNEALQYHSKLLLRIVPEVLLCLGSKVVEVKVVACNLLAWGQVLLYEHWNQTSTNKVERPSGLQLSGSQCHPSLANDDWYYQSQLSAAISPGLTVIRTDHSTTLPA